MNKKINILLACCIALLIGIVLYALHHQWILFRTINPIMHTARQAKTKKACMFHYWHNNRWHTESQEVIWSSQTHENLMTLISYWLSLLDAEQILPKKVTLQSATLTPHKQEAYLSFDRTIVLKEWSTQRKLMLIEGLLKTLRSNAIPLRGIYILVHHQPLIDTHLDFSAAWPIAGFIGT